MQKSKYNKNFINKTILFQKTNFKLDNAQVISQLKYFIIYNTTEYVHKIGIKKDYKQQLETHFFNLTKIFKSLLEIIT